MHKKKVSIWEAFQYGLTWRKRVNLERLFVEKWLENLREAFGVNFVYQESFRRFILPYTDIKITRSLAEDLGWENFFDLYGNDVKQRIQQLPKAKEKPG